MYHETECGCGQHGHSAGPGMGHGGEWGHHGHRERGRVHHGGGSCCCGCGCGCHNGGIHYRKGSFNHEFIERRFISKEEVIAKLEEYLKQLQAEGKGVEERIARLRKTKGED